MRSMIEFKCAMIECDRPAVVEFFPMRGDGSGCWTITCWKCADLFTRLGYEPAELGADSIAALEMHGAKRCGQ